jgi:hypothetical protein
MIFVWVLLLFMICFFRQLYACRVIVSAKIHNICPPYLCCVIAVRKITDAFFVLVSAKKICGGFHFCFLAQMRTPPCGFLKSWNRSAALLESGTSLLVPNLEYPNFKIFLGYYIR